MDLNYPINVKSINKVFNYLIKVSWIIYYRVVFIISKEWVYFNNTYPRIIINKFYY